MSGMDRLTVTDGMIDAAVEHYAEGGCMGLGGDEKREVVASILEAGLRELLAHRRASQAAPAPSDGLREAFIAGAMAVHSQWLHAIEQGETPPRGDPEFGEAADDYCAALSIPTPAPSDALWEALEPFAKAADIKLCGEWRDDQSISRTDVAFSITFGDLRRAREALTPAPAKEGGE